MKKILLLLTFLTSIYSVSYAQCTPVVSIFTPFQMVCPGTPVTFTPMIANGGSNPTYQWRRNGINYPGATNAVFTIFPTMSNDSYDLVVTSSESCANPAIATSNAIVIYLNPIPTISATLVSDVTGTCMGSPVVFTSLVTGSGSTPAPTYEWFVTSSSTSTAGISMGAPSITATTFTTSALTATNNKVYVQVKSNTACATTTAVASNVVPIMLTMGIGSGTIGSDQTICYNTVPATITQLTAPTNITGTPTNTWETSLSASGPFAIIPSATGATYTPPPIGLTKDVYIRRVITDPGTPAPCNVAYSNLVHITVRPQLVNGIIGVDQSTCAGSPTATITQNVTPIGGTGIYTYQWQSSTSGPMGPFTPIAGATNLSYNAGTLTATTYYRQVAASGPCGNVTSNVVTKTVTAPEVVTVSIDNFPTQICAGTSLTFTATASTTGTGYVSYQWFLGSTPVGTNSTTYNYLSAIGDNGKVVKVVATTSTECNAGPAISTPFILDIVNSSTPTITISANQVNCMGLPITFTATSTGSGSSPFYQWNVVSSGSPFGTLGTPVGTGGTFFSSTTLTTGDRVYVELTSSLACIVGTNPYKSNEITMVIKPIPTPVISESDQTICSPNTFTFHANVFAGSTYQWVFNGVYITGATTAAYTVTQSGTYYISEANSACSSTSGTVTLTVDPCGAFSTTITGPNPITLGQQNAVYGVPNQTGFTYTWSITGGTIVSGQNTNAVTVDWDAPVTNSLARTTSTPYSISVLEKNPSNQTKTTTSTINTITTGTTLSQPQSGINIFPNPTTGAFNIEMPESGVDVTYDILDITGLSVASGTFISTGNDQTISADLDAGMYQIVLTYNNVVTCVRLSKVQ